MKKMCIYIHIPFCEKRCYYCSFISYKNAENFFEGYFKALKTEIYNRRHQLKDCNIVSVYFGGGTPSFPPSYYLKDIMLFLRQNFCIDKLAEITAEANPGTLNGQKLNDMLSCGINRYSIGLQSANENLLMAVGRTHTTQNFVNSINLLKSFGVKNISADIMLGLPSQTIADVKDTICLLTNLNIPHLSAYGLKCEKKNKDF